MVDTNPHRDFVAELGKLNVRLPVKVTNEVGVIADTDGRSIITVDLNSEWPDAEVKKISLFIVLAINFCGGFEVQLGQTDG